MSIGSVTFPDSDAYSRKENVRIELHQQSTLSGSDDSDVPPPVVKFPEGGWQAWTTLLGTVLIQYGTFGYAMAYGVYNGFSFIFTCARSITHHDKLDFYVREYLTDFTPSEIGWIGGAQIFLIFSSGLLVGRAFDKGYVRHLMISGCTLHALSIFMLSITQKNKFYQVFLAHGVGAGLASGLTYIPCLGLVSHYFNRRRPMAIGLVSAGTALGATLQPIMLNHLFYNPRVGFHNGVRISAGLNTFLFIIGNLLMRPRLAPKKVSGPLINFKFFYDVPYLLMVIGGVFTLAGLFFPSFYLQVDAIVHGVDPNEAFYYVAIMNGASIIGRTVPSFLAPRLGVTNMNILFTFFMGVIALCMVVVKTVTGFIFLAISYGIASGGTISLTPSMIAGQAKSVDEVGARIGVAFACASLTALLGLPISGALLTTNLYWIRGSLFSGLVMIFSVLFLALARQLLVRRRGTHIL